MRKTIASVEKELNLALEALSKMKELLSSSQGKVEVQLKEIHDLTQINGNLRTSLNVSEARRGEVLVAHDMTLRQLLRLQGTEWEEIERIIGKSREAYQIHPNREGRDFFYAGGTS